MTPPELPAYQDPRKVLGEPTSPAEAAAFWWGDRLGMPFHIETEDAFDKYDVAAQEEYREQREVLGLDIRSQIAPHLTDFVQELTVLTEDAYPSPQASYTLHTDWQGPVGLLRRAAQRAHMQTSVEGFAVFPPHSATAYHGSAGIVWAYETNGNNAERIWPPSITPDIE